MANVGTAVVAVVPSMDGFASSINKSVSGINLGKSGKKVGKSLTEGIGSTLKSGSSALAGIFGGVAATLTSEVMGAISGLTGEMVEASDSAQKFASTLSFAGIDSSTIDALTKSTQRYADETVYELSDIRNVTAQLAANGVDNYAQLAEAAKEDPDFYIWLNDDMLLKPGAFSVLLENSSYLKHRAIVVGTAVDSKGEYSYGGRTVYGRIIPPDPVIPVVCDIFNGNLVLVPKSVYEAVGTMDQFYSHGFGDFDYGVRADKAGITSVVAPGVLAVCDRNPGIPKWRNAAFPLKERFSALSDPKGRPLKEQFVYDSRRSNVFVAAGHICSILLKVLFPKREK